MRKLNQILEGTGFYVILHSTIDCQYTAEFLQEEELAVYFLMQGTPGGPAEVKHVSGFLRDIKKRLIEMGVAA